VKKCLKTQRLDNFEMSNGTLNGCGEGFRLNIELYVLKKVPQKGWWHQKVGEKVRKHINSG
jgi:hypothetical protein